jgi:hypothetical protein
MIKALRSKTSTDSTVYRLSGPDAVVLAERALQEGREDDAKRLIEIAYAAFDRDWPVVRPSSRRAANTCRP